MNHKELRRECEPSLSDLIEERANAELKQIPRESNFPVDFDLIARVLRNERRRELEKQWAAIERIKRGQLAKRSNSSVTGKKANVA